jgi:carbon starvation protein CstA
MPIDEKNAKNGKKPSFLLSFERVINVLETNYSGKEFIAHASHFLLTVNADNYYLFSTLIPVDVICSARELHVTYVARGFCSKINYKLILLSKHSEFFRKDQKRKNTLSFRSNICH